MVADLSVIVRMLGKIALAALFLSAAALAAEPRSHLLYSKHLEDERSGAGAQQDKFIERGDAIARRAIASICTGCLDLRYTRQQPSPLIDTAYLVAEPQRRRPTRSGANASRQQATPKWKQVLLAHLIRH